MITMGTLIAFVCVLYLAVGAGIAATGWKEISEGIASGELEEAPHPKTARVFFWITLVFLWPMFITGAIVTGGKDD